MMQDATLVQTLTLYSNILHLVLFCVVFCGILKYCPLWLQHIPLVVLWNNEDKWILKAYCTWLYVMCPRYGKKIGCE